MKEIVKNNKENMKKNIVKRQTGITLIALVVTIIVLLILAGITIITLTGNNGIIKQATEAKKQTVAGQEIDALNMAITSLNMEKYSENTDYFDELVYISEDIIKTLGYEDGENYVNFSQQVEVGKNTLVFPIEFEKSGNIYYIKIDYEKGKAEILKNDEYRQLIKYEAENITDDEKKKLESGIALEINSGSDGELTLTLVEHRSESECNNRLGRRKIQ